MFGHVGPHTGGDVVVDRPDGVNRDSLPAHDLNRDVGQSLGVGELAGDALGAGLVVPQIRIGGLVLQLLDAPAQPLDIEHPLHRGQGGVEGGDFG